MSAAGAGGKIVAKGQEVRAVPIQRTVHCAAFTGIEAEGG